MDTPDHIAVVDEDPAIRDLPARQSQRLDLRVTPLASGRTLRSALDQSPIDLIVLDVTMPGEDGLAVMKTLRGCPHAAIPVLLPAALGDEVDRIIGLRVPRPRERLHDDAREPECIKAVRNEGCVPAKAASRHDEVQA